MNKEGMELLMIESGKREDLHAKKKMHTTLNGSFKNN